MRRQVSPLVAVALFGVTLLAVPALFGVSTANAQQQLGTPSLDSKLEAGSIVVRVVNGVMSRPLSALSVSLVDESSGKELVVRTGPDGRAPFRNLKKGNRYTAFIKVGDKEAASQPITVPASGGATVLLSPVPLRAEPTDSAPAGPHGGGAQGMPDPRQMSGQPRPEPKDAGGTLTVRLIQGKFRIDELGNRTNDFPKDGLVHLVKLRAGGTIEVVSEKIDDEGRVQFRRLKTNNTESYWVFSSIDRGGKFDRMQSPSIELPPQVGLRLMLAGLAPDSPAPGVDDISAIRAGEPAPAIGTVLIELAGQSAQISNVELVDMRTMKVVGAAQPLVEQQRGPVQVRLGDPTPATELRDGLVQVRVFGPTGALAGAKVLVSPMTETGEAAATKVTDASGLVSFDELRPGQGYAVVIDAVGKTAALAKPLIIPTEGGARVDAQFSWQNRPPATLAKYTGIAPGLYIGRAKNSSGTYWSAPFQMVADRGAIAQMFVYPNLLFKFQGGAELDDEKLWFPTQFALWNPSVMPIDFGKEGLLIPLPKGFTGAAVADEMTSRVRVDGDHGFVWKGAFPPGQRSFRTSFALPVENGSVEFEMPLPFGTIDSHLFFEDLPGMELNVPNSAKRETMERGGKAFVMLKQISIRPGQSLVLSVRGLPQKPSWKRSMPLVVGVGVLSLLLWGFAAIFLHGSRRGGLHPGSRAFLENKREELLRELVLVDDKLAKQTTSKKKKKGAVKELSKQRKELLASLESVYSQLED